MNINFDFSDLQSFLAVAEHHSFQQAAQQLNLSQPALTRRIQKLEKTLDVVLLERSTRAVNLTLAGKNFRARAEVMLEEANEAVLALRDPEQQFAYQRKTIITIAMIPTITRTIVMQALQHFHQQGYTARIRLLDGNANEVAEAVAQGEADFGLSFIPANEPGLSFEQITEDPFGLVMLRSDPLYCAQAIHWAEIDSSRLILPWKGTGNRMLIDDALARAGTTLNWAYEVKRSATVLDMVAAGVGIAVLPQSVITAEATGDIVVRTLIAPEVTRSLGVIRRPGQTLSVLAEQMLAGILVKADTQG